MAKLEIPAEVYSRVVGYFRPVNQWNIGKKEEYAERVEVLVPLEALEPERLRASTRDFNTREKHELSRV